MSIVHILRHVKKSWICKQFQVNISLYNELSNICSSFKFKKNMRI